ncbi:MAG: phosphoglucosamine mutase [Rikenellaceae bacterium]
MALIKSISGIRGTIGGAPKENLTPIDIVKFTTAYARLIGERRTEGAAPLTIVVGRDARLSGTMVQSIVEGTLIGCGVDVISVGMCTTPGVEMAVTHYEADGGIIITASHNPAQWNALKLLNADGEFLNAAEGKELLDLTEDETFEFPTIEKIGRLKFSTDFNSTHIDKVLALPLVDTDAIKQRRFRVVVDAVNSIGGVVIPELLRRLGCDVIELNCEPTGNFAHSPEPLKENLTEIAAAVPANGADFGVVVDPDVDRLALICEDGSMFGEEYTLVAVADYILSHKKGSTVSNLSSSRALRDLTNSYGCDYYAAAVGEVNVVAQMKAQGAVIGGEGNGGVIYPELHYGRDALVGVALLLTHLSQRGGTLGALRATYPEYYMSKNKLELTDPNANIDAMLLAVKELYKEAQINDIDGVKIDLAESWIHLRKSNTEPIVRIYTEAKSEAEAEQLAKKIKGEMDSLIKQL